MGAGALASCASSSDAGGQLPEARYVPFEGTHQTGITAIPVPARSLMAAFSVQTSDRAGLRRLFTELTEEIRGLMAGRPIEQRDPTYPPLDSGILGTRPPADDLSVVVSVGSTLFDDRSASPSSSSRCRFWPTIAWTRLARTVTCCSPLRPATPTPSSSRCAS
jgi:deferrochelatase/peroxidase EfeB